MSPVLHKGKGNQLYSCVSVHVAARHCARHVWVAHSSVADAAALLGCYVSKDPSALICRITQSKKRLPWSRRHIAKCLSSDTAHCPTVAACSLTRLSGHKLLRLLQWDGKCVTEYGRLEVSTLCIELRASEISACKETVRGGWWKLINRTVVGFLRSSFSRSVKVWNVR